MKQATKIKSTSGRNFRLILNTLLFAYRQHNRNHCHCAEFMWMSHGTRQERVYIELLYAILK